MNGFLVALTLIVFIVLILVAGMRPRPSAVSRFELTRRQKTDASINKVLEREDKLAAIWSLLMVDIAILLVVFTCLAIVTFGWGWGVALAVTGALTFGAFARVPLVAKLSQRWFRALEPNMLATVEKIEPFLRAIRPSGFVNSDDYRRFDSREELQYLIDKSGTILSENERKLMVHGLSFGERQVEEIMTPRSVIFSISKDEFLGPLVLSEIHSNGHSRLPVTAGDLNHIVGVLHLRDLLSLDNKSSSTAENMMEAKVFYIHQKDTLEHALAAFLKTRHHLFVVINDERETVGLLSLEDVLEALLGRPIVDEDDNHADLRAVAAKNGAHNNTPQGRVDV